jgi:Protein of unknown function (DUF4239)
MPLWAYQTSPLTLALLMFAVIEGISLGALYLTRRYLLGRFRYHDGINDAISGSVQAIGVFYGITVGLIAVGVWNTYSTAGDLVSREATAIGGLHRDFGGYPSPLREELRANLREYTVSVIDKAWPEQREGRLIDSGTYILDSLQTRLFAFQPSTDGQTALHSETLRAYNTLIEYRRLRIDAVGSGLSSVMWVVIWVGAAFSISVAYLYRIEDPKLHFILVGLMAGFLAVVLFMIVINDRPLVGRTSITPDPYKLILERLLDLSH